MIKEIKLIDFTKLTKDELDDSENIIKELKKYKEKTGNLDKKILIGNNDLKVVSITNFFERFKNKEELTLKLIEEGIIEQMIDFKYSKHRNAIIEDQSYSIKWIVENYNSYKKIIDNSILKLINKLPEDPEDIHYLITYGSNGNEEKSGYYHPILNIINNIKRLDVSDLFFKNYKNIKAVLTKEYKNVTGIDLLINKGFQTDYETLISLYENNIISFDEIKKSESEINLFVLNLISSNKIQLLEELIKQKKISFEKMDNGSEFEKLSLSYAKTKKMATFLLNNGALIKTERKGASGSCVVDLIKYETFGNIDTFEAILEHNGDLWVKENKDYLYNAVSGKKFDFLKLLVDKYKIDITNMDVLLYGHKKTLYDDSDGVWDWIKKQSIDTRICKVFCDEIVKSREDGLKKLRMLNKEGIIVSKSPDIIYNILRNNVTKAFLIYYDKLTKTDIEKYTIDGNPVWWAGENINTFLFLFEKTENKIQKGKDGKSFLVYLLEKEFKEYNSNSLFIWNKYLEKIKNKYSYSELIDISYKDKHQNNILHILFKTEKYKKTKINRDLFNFIINNESVENKERIIDLIFQKNSYNKKPIEFLLETAERGISGEISEMIFYFIKNMENDTRFFEKNESGVTTYELIKEYAKNLKNKELDKRIEVIDLKLEMKDKQPNGNKLKI